MIIARCTAFMSKAVRHMIPMLSPLALKFAEVLLFQKGAHKLASISTQQCIPVFSRLLLL
jgi:hypothetical protein